MPRGAPLQIFGSVLVAEFPQGLISDVGFEGVCDHRALFVALLVTHPVIAEMFGLPKYLAFQDRLLRDRRF
jgi:hypothetical protein